MPSLIHQEGQLTKLTFIPCIDASCSQENTKVPRYTVMFNPNNIAVKLQVDRDATQANGETSAPLTFKNIKPHDFSFEFIIDGTGSNGEAKKLCHRRLKNSSKLFMITREIITSLIMLKYYMEQYY